MFNFFKSKTRNITISPNGDIHEQSKESTINNSGINFGSSEASKGMLISSDAVSKITERAMGIAFDKWAAEFLKQNDPQNKAEPKEDNSKPTIDSNKEDKNLKSKNSELIATQKEVKQVKSLKTKSKNPATPVPSQASKSQADSNSAKKAKKP